MRVSEPMLVDATEEHLSGIAEIYNDAVVNSTATFDLVPRSLEEQRAWLGEHGGRYPVLVALLGNEVVGWGAISPHHERPCYAGTVEDSVYVKEGHRGHGIGTRILGDLIGRATEAGHHAILARVDAGNEVSLRLHISAGFSEVGRLK